MRLFSMMVVITALAVLMLAGSAGASPVEEWNRTYPDIVVISDIEQTVDGGYIIAAYGSIVKIDSSGNERWIRKLSKSETASHISLDASQVEQTKDGGYIFGGRKSFGGDFGLKEISLAIKTDAEGIEQWNRTFDENIDEFYTLRGETNSIQQTLDGGYILAESTMRNNTIDARVIKLDSGGNTEWMKPFDTSSQPSVLQTTDGGYIISISRDSWGKYPYTGLIKIG